MAPPGAQTAGRSTSATTPPLYQGDSLAGPEGRRAPLAAFAFSCPVGPRALADRHFLVDRRVPAGPEDLVLVSVVHSVAMMMAGGFSAWLVYRYLGLKFVSRSWFNLDATWAFSFILVGALSLSISLAGGRH